MNTLKILDFSFFFKNYKVNCVHLDSKDFLITKVKVPLLDNIVDKIEYYINNKKDCDTEIKKYSENILKNLSDSKIADNFKEILKDINKDFIVE